LVIRNQPRDAHGDPFPSTFWLTCPEAVKAVSRIESDGAIARLNERFDADRGENRLRRSALDKVCGQAKEAGNRRLAFELAHQLLEIPPSVNFAKDFDQWRSDRLTGHYRPVRPW